MIKRPERLKTGSKRNFEVFEGESKREKYRKYKESLPTETKVQEGQQDSCIEDSGIQ